MSFYNVKILNQAAKTSFVHIVWLFALIGTPIVFFNHGLSLSQKTILFFGLLVFFWLTYLGLCVAIHQFKLRDKNNQTAYLKKSDIEKGKDIGSLLEGW
ncbi:hypothetical protein [Alteromonas oceanisediminis]|uniref:hypothetical protein n=1 Tax=Alteromonas oceanisediminis TaxID=2836180 RepID=UPI001BD973F9|nr:hypothetical protein [Alteromonas oceanisediminis]MBT0586946.1 hypothetical protein [Alteromonas oceanisediminis]